MTLTIAWLPKNTVVNGDGLIFIFIIPIINTLYYINIVLLLMLSIIGGSIVSKGFD